MLNPTPDLSYTHLNYPEAILKNANSTPSNNNPTDTAQKIIKPPTNLQYESTLILHTKSAFRIFQGKKGNVGLFRFAKLIATIWHAAALDDPYADLFLCKIFAGLKQVKAYFVNEEQTLKPLVEPKLGLNHHLPQSKSPAIIPLHFHFQYAYMAAELLSFYDYLFMLLHATVQAGITLDNPLHVMSNHWIKALQTVFNLPKQYKNLNLTRNDIKQQTPLAVQAIELMGKLDQKILNKTLRAPFAPHIFKQNNQPKN